MGLTMVQRREHQPNVTVEDFIARAITPVCNEWMRVLPIVMLKDDHEDETENGYCEKCVDNSVFFWRHFEIICEVNLKKAGVEWDPTIRL